MDKKQFLKSLPRKRLSSGVLLYNSQNYLLLVKPSYKDYWSLPGGISEKWESPREAASRECKEEIGLSLTDLELVGVVYQSNKELKDEVIHTFFTSKTLSPKQISQIRVDGDEIVDFKFVPLKDIGKYNKKLKKYIKYLNPNSLSLRSYFEEIS